MKRLEIAIKKSYLASNSTKLKAEKMEIEIDMGGFGGIIQGSLENEKVHGKESEKLDVNTPNKINFSSKYDDLSDYLVSRLEALHWSDTHRGEKLLVEIYVL